MKRLQPLCVRVFLLCMILPGVLLGQKKVITPPGFPSGGTSSPGILSDDTLNVSGQVGEDLKTHQIPAEFEAEMKNCLTNISMVLKAAGMEMKDVVAVQVYLTDLSLFDRMNAVYKTFFPEPRPTRTTVGVTKLTAAGAHIEITVTARK
jgi:2-iminobutanoate/2-iminopropanoate deaminase